MPAPAPRRARRSQFTDRFTFGGGVPGVVGALMAAVVTSSLVFAIAVRHHPWLQTLLLVPARVFRGEVWSLLTWSFLESGPIPLLFEMLAFWWFGSDLARAWGERRFARVYFGMVAAIGALTCLVGLVDAEVRDFTYMGTLPMTEALLVAWGLTYPDAEVRIYFLIPITGRVLFWLTIFLTVATAAYYGWHVVFPALLADALMIAYVKRGDLLRRLRPKRPAKPRDLSKVRVKRKGHLWVVTDEDDRRS
ncbi:MAG: rhomboid family intramembrane serine protease [Polyangiales bacterium]